MQLNLDDKIKDFSSQKNKNTLPVLTARLGFFTSLWVYNWEKCIHLVFDSCNHTTLFTMHKKQISSYKQSQTHKGIETCSTVPCSEIFKANLHILSTIFGNLKLNSKWPLCYKTNLSWNIANFIKVLEEFLSSYGYYMLCNYPLSFLEHKKDYLFEKNILKEKVNIP